MKKKTAKKHPLREEKNLIFLLKRPTLIDFTI